MQVVSNKYKFNWDKSKIKYPKKYSNISLQIKNLLTKNIVIYS